ncbi:MAG: M1 family metallopeptidase [Deltaproteobacteria bacterium]|nr:M1 family metallopeptidase [Deltaproteobacteria bacterium]MBW2359866.1 M1 family metallopeptidase [Deltaproteobacteria bacterium]
MGASQRKPAYRLPAGVKPLAVDLHVDVDPQKSDAFRGEVAISIELSGSRRAIRLHAQDLRISKARIETPNGGQRGAITPLPEVEMIEVRFPRPVPAGCATLKLAFAGKLRRDLCGLYAARVGRRQYAFTQLEATDARKFFPCFDEPAMKARFRIAVTTAKRNAVVSNSPIAHSEPAGRGRKRVQFEETPLLSTYLIALAVGELECSRPVRLGPTRICVWHTPGKGKLTRFGLEAAKQTLARLERYFDLPYPYAKLDLVAVPDFEFGAMENAGAVFFRETLLLLDPATATAAEQKRAAEVIAHELAHMWYGDLVTMAWWDDLWLNEAFATWMAFAVVADWKPEWHMWHDFQHGRAAALELDALRHTHPIYCPVKTAAEANENFDLITYEKGAAIVRMLERYLGANRFRRGVRRYIRKHREGNTVADDLWRALSEASGEPVEALARAWIEQEGYPVVGLRLRRRGGRAQLVASQTRFNEQPQRGAGRKARWPIPLVIRVADAPGRRGRLVRELLNGARTEIDLGRATPSIVYGNAEEAGFFRPQHAPDELAAILAAPRSLTPIERMGLVDHQWALARAGRAPLSSFLSVVDALARERDPDVLTALQRPLAFLANDLIPEAAPDVADAFADFVGKRFGPPFAKLGWRRRGGESDGDGLRRAALLSLVGGVAARPDVLADAAGLCDRYLADRRAIPPDIADSVVGLTARNGDAARHRSFVDAMQKASTPQEQRRFLLALGAFREPRLIAQTLALSLTPAVATQDVIFLLARMLANPGAREASWQFIQSRWPRLEKRLPSLLASRLIESTTHLGTAQHRTEVARFFRAHPVPSGDRALRQTLERFDWYRGFRREAARSLRAHLAASTGA